MKKLLLILLCLPFIGFGQDFIQIQNTSFSNFSFSSIAFSDIDNDGDEDVLISGYSNGSISELYTNDGLGNFGLVTNTPFTNVGTGGSIAFSDVDNDGDEDVLISGEYGYSNGVCYVISELYTNDGLGNFSLVTGTPFTGAFDGSIAFSDIDNDGDEDILITGRREMYPSFNAITELYTNDGLGNFSLVIGTPFPNIWGSDIAFSDIDGDGDEDLLITGNDNNQYALTELYTNDGIGNFTMVPNTSFIGVYASSIGFSDIENDGDEDVLIAGRYCTAGVCYVTTDLYHNDGAGNFSLVSGTTFSDIYQGSVAFSDLDNDGDEDVMISGQNLAELYQNDGIGNFTLVTNTPFIGVYNSSITFSDIDNDGDEDALITGSTDVGGFTGNTSLYSNISSVSNIYDFILSTNKELLKVTDLLGRETKGTNQPLFYIYDDGTVEKRIVIE
jgi:hypothetical protein